MITVCTILFSLSLVSMVIGHLCHRAGVKAFQKALECHKQVRALLDQCSETHAASIRNAETSLVFRETARAMWVLAQAEGYQDEEGWKQ